MTDLRSIIEKYKSSGAIRVIPPPKLAKPVHNYAEQKERINKACDELLAKAHTFTTGIRKGRMFPYGAVSAAANKYKCDAQSLRNALGRRREAMKS